MCGLFGMMGPGISVPDLFFMKDLAYVSGLRGSDGTGIFQTGVYKKSRVSPRYLLEKGRSEVSYFLWFHENDTRGNNDVLGNVSDNIFMGHVRAATKGDVNDANAHPFDVGRIVGAHNGTLRDTKYESKTKTDSELFLTDISKRGPIEVLKELDKDSAYAVTMFDKSSGEMKFFKNDKRPLYYAFNTKRRVLYWASERKMLEFVAERSNLDISSLIYRFTDGVIYSLAPLDVNVNKIPDWKITHINPKVEVPSVVRFTPERENLNHVLMGPPKLLSPPKSAILPLNLNLRKKSENKVKLLTACVYCKTEMDPLAQYYGTEISANVYACKTCEDINTTMLKEHMERHSPKGLVM